MEEMDDTLITFDKGVFFRTIEGLEENYLEFLDLNDSFYGWLLTLSDDEFKEVYENYLFGDGMGLHFVEMAHKDIWQVLKSEVTKRIAEQRVMIRMILLVKEGIFTYTPGETDSLWRIDVTEKGKKIADSLALLSALRYTKELAESEKVLMLKKQENGDSGDSGHEDGPGLEIVE